MTNGRAFGIGAYLPLFFDIVDTIVVNVAFCLIFLCNPVVSDNPSFNIRTLWVLANIGLLPLFYYHRRRRHSLRAMRMENEILKCIAAVCLHALVFVPLILFLNLWPGGASGKLLLWFYLITLGMLMITRIFARLIIKKLRKRGFNHVNVVIIGTGPTATRLYNSMMKDPGFGYKVLGFFGDTAPNYQDLDCPGGSVPPWLGPVGTLQEFIDHHKVQQIFYTLSGEHGSMAEVIRVADRNVTEFYYVPQISRYFTRRFELNSIGSIPVLNTLHNPLKSWHNRLLKRAFDILVSGTFLLFYPLIYIPVAIGIKLSSPGPVYFRQKRTGYLGRDFDCLKFRTMKVNADSDKAQATQDDPRKTKFGAFLRKTSIDELPQFINVFKGDMSIIGPRPHMLKHTKDYSRLVDRYMVRHAIKPGITGWAQVNGYRGLTDELWKMERRVEYDVWYIEHWSFLLDLKIMFRTVWNAVKGEDNAF